MSLLVLVATLGCGNDELRAFQSARIEAVCDWHDRCDSLDDGGYADVESCRRTLASATQASAAASPCAAFDAESADACLSVWAEAECGVALDLAACEGVCE